MKTAFPRPIVIVLLAMQIFPQLCAATDPTEPNVSANTTETGRMANGKVDINTADPATLEKLPGVGTEFANAIIASRPYKSVDELARVPGLGPERIKALRSRVTASPVKATASKPDVSRVSEPSAPTAINAGKAISRQGVTESYEGQNAAGKKTETTSPNTARATEQPRDEHGRFVRTADAKKVNLNTASKAELEALPEIGPVKADAIIAARPFSTPEDVMRVNGIKSATFDAIKDRITVR
jgi:competence protein ComEA